MDEGSIVPTEDEVFLSKTFTGFSEEENRPQPRKEENITAMVERLVKERMLEEKEKIKNELLKEASKWKGKDKRNNKKVRAPVAIKSPSDTTIYAPGVLRTLNSAGNGKDVVAPLDVEKPQQNDDENTTIKKIADL